MAKKKPQKKNFWQKYATERNFVIFFIALFISSIAGLIYLDHQSTINAKYAKDVARYKYLEGRMRTVMDSVILTAGQPYELNHRQGCGHTSQEWGKGQLTCSNAYVFDYEVNSKEEGAQLTKLLANKFLESANTKSHDSYNPVTSPELATVYFNEAQKFGCDFQYNLYTGEFHNQILGSNYAKPATSKYVAEYSYGCGGNVAKALYPVSD